MNSELSVGEYESQLKQAAILIQNSDAILIGTGAGMGVDSGIGTFRGKYAGIWPPLEKLKIDFTQMSNPQRFVENPHFAWSFWNFRFMSYTTNQPHNGYSLLKEWSEKKPLGGFSFTSNIDGHWLESGFSEKHVLECHGSIRFMQCQRPNKKCDKDLIWKTNSEEISNLIIDEGTNYAKDPLPKCPNCGGISRPNVLMFYDSGLIWTRNAEQEKNYEKWLFTLMKKENRKLVVIEIGAGTAVSTVRDEMEQRAQDFSAPLIRINIEAPKIPLDIDGVSIPLSALPALSRINQLMNER